MPKNRPYCFTIAGFDPSGGAGVLADIKTFENLKICGLSVLTSNTIQTEKKFVSVNWIEKQIIIDQLETLLKSYTVKFFKIGLIENAETLLEIILTIKKHNQNSIIIWDPVLKPSFGGNLNENRFTDLKQQIFSTIDYIIPNVPEAEVLFANEEIENITLKHKVKIILKGGHSENLGWDNFYNNGLKYTFKPQSLSRFEKHGTGCIFSSAFTANLANGYPVLKAIRKAKNFTLDRINSNSKLLSYF